MGQILTHAIRLSPGQDLRLEIENYANVTGIEAGWIGTCVGSLTKACLRLAGSSQANTFNGPFEILSLVGTLSKNGSHLHICISDAQGTTLGGHLLEGTIIRTTAELILCESKTMIFTREMDAETEWKELMIYRKT